jgi:hypothetical protein
LLVRFTRFVLAPWENEVIEIAWIAEKNAVVVDGRERNLDEVCGH